MFEITEGSVGNTCTADD